MLLMGDGILASDLEPGKNLERECGECNKDLRVRLTDDIGAPSEARRAMSPVATERRQLAGGLEERRWISVAHGWTVQCVAPYPYRSNNTAAAVSRGLECRKLPIANNRY